MKRWALERVHISWFLACFSTGVLLGIALSLVVYLHLWWMYVVFLLIGVVLTRQRRMMLAVILLAGMLAGICRGSAERIKLLDYKPYYGQELVVSGKVTEDASYSADGAQSIRLGAVVIGDMRLAGEVWVGLATDAGVKRGDIVTVSGTLQKGFGTMAASMYRAETLEVLQPKPGDVGRQARDAFGERVAAAIPAPEYALGMGFLTGQRSALPEDLNDQLRTVALTHVVVASGYNLTILVRFARRAFARISKYLATLAAGSMIVGFLFVTGLSPSMSRAALVCGLSLAAWYFGRVIHPFVLLPVSAAVTALIRPSYVWGDIGWYLSFAAFAGIMVLAPLVHHHFWGKKRPGMVRQILVDTTCAQIATLPIILFVFGMFSVYALPANLVILPLVPLAMLLTFLSGIGTLLVPQIALWFGGPAYALLHYMVSVIGWIANLPSAKTEITFDQFATVLSYCVLVCVIIILWRANRRTFNFRQTSIVE